MVLLLVLLFMLGFVSLLFVVEVVDGFIVGLAVGRVDWLVFVFLLFVVDVIDGVVASLLVDLVVGIVSLFVVVI
jgi:hypothetical protein